MDNSSSELVDYFIKKTANRRNTHGNGGWRAPRGGVKSDINVTPLVDVMLVLLIIMMVIAPMLNQGVQLTLPDASKQQSQARHSDQTVVSVDAWGLLYVNAMGPIQQADVVKRLQRYVRAEGQKLVYLKGDTDAPYGAIMDMMDALRKAQIDQVALITEKRSRRGAKLMAHAHAHHGAERIVRARLCTSPRHERHSLIDVLSCSS
jgi:biopolymer transport protein ExbD